MLNEQTIEKLYAMKLNAMAEVFKEQLQLPDMNELSFDEIADLVGASPRTVSRRYQSGIQSIRSRLNIKLEEFTRG